MVERRAATRQPRYKIRTECFEQHINTLIELVNMLVVALSQNAANMAPTIPPGIPLTNVEGKEALPHQVGRDAMASEAQTNTKAHRRCARRRHQNATQVMQECREPP